MEYKVAFLSTNKKQEEYAPILIVKKFWLRYWRAGYFVGTVLVLYALTSHWSYDDPYITYRYSENIWRGLGPVYNEGVKVLSTTTPLLALLLSVFRFFWSDLPQVAVFLGTISLALGGLILYELATLHRTYVIGWFSLIAYPTFPLLLQTLSSETPIYITLILAGVWTYQTQKYSLTGLMSALIVLVRPDGVLVPFILGLHYLFFVRRAIPWRAVFVFLVITVLWFGFALIYFGSALPVTLQAKQQQGEMAISQRFLAGVFTVFEWYLTLWPYWVAASIGGIGLLYIIIRRIPWWLIFVWTAAYFIAYTLLGVTRYFWYYAPLVPSLILCTGSGLQFLWQIARTNKNFPIRLLSASLLIISITSLAYFQVRYLWRFQYIYDDRIAVYREVGEWLRANTSVDTTVAALEVGAIGYYSQRTMIDFAGLIQPDIASQLSIDTTYQDAANYAVIKYHPDYIVVFKDDFQTLREQYISKNCGLLSEFQKKKVRVELFSCR